MNWKHPVKMADGRSFRQKIGFYLIKLPFMLITIIIGFVLEFLIELPFMVMCTLDRIFGVQKSGRPPKVGR